MIRELKANELLIVLDFKQDIPLGHGPNEEGQAFYSRINQSLLGFVVYSGQLPPESNPIWVDYVGPVLSKTSQYIIDAINHLLSGTLDEIDMENIDKVIFWMDTGNHNRSYYMTGHLLYNIPRQFGVKVSVNYFAECHGKSVCDQHFSTVSYFVKQSCMQSDMNSLDDLILAIKNGHENARLHAVANNTPTHGILHVIQWDPEDNINEDLIRLQFSHIGSFYSFSVPPNEINNVYNHVYSDREEKTLLQYQVTFKPRVAYKRNETVRIPEDKLSDAKLTRLLQSEQRRNKIVGS